MSVDLDQTLVALADPSRRLVVDLLAKRPRRAGELARVSHMSAPAMSRHLRLLRRCGIVEEQRSEDDARVRVYRLRRRAFVALRSWLHQVESFWTEQLVAFKEHAEGAAQGSATSRRRRTQDRPGTRHAARRQRRVRTQRKTRR